MLYHPQLSLLEFENSISGVALYLHITDRPHLLMSGRDWLVLGPQPTHPEGENSPEVPSKTATHSFALLSDWKYLCLQSLRPNFKCFPKRTSPMENSSPLNNFYHLISDSDWDCQHCGGHLTEEVI